MRSEELFVRAVVRSLQEHGQAATQFVTAHLDGDVSGAPDIVFSSNEPDGFLVCVEVRKSSVPISGVVLERVLEHRRAIEQANPDVVYALATDANLVGIAGPPEDRIVSTQLTTLPIDWEDPASLAFAIKMLSIASTPKVEPGLPLLSPYERAVLLMIKDYPNANAFLLGTKLVSRPGLKVPPIALAGMISRLEHGLRVVERSGQGWALTSRGKKVAG